MLLLKIFGIFYILSICNGNPIGPSDEDQTRRLSNRRHHHHRPTFHDDVDTAWDDDNLAPEIIDLTGVDPCENKSCQAHMMCVVRNRNETVCISKKDIFRYSGIYSSPDHCVSCEIDSRDIPVCGSNGQTFSSDCVLRYQACLKNLNLRVICGGECPCPLNLMEQAVEPDMKSYDVTKVLGPPQHLTVTPLEDDKTSARVTVSWQPPVGYDALLGKTSIEDYIIHYSEEGDSQWKSARTPGSVTSLSITGLKRGALYYFRIQARTALQIGTLSDAVFHWTLYDHTNLEKLDDTTEGNTVDDEEGQDHEASGRDDDYTET